MYNGFDRPTKVSVIQMTYFMTLYVVFLSERCITRRKNMLGIAAAVGGKLCRDRHKWRTSTFQ